jgi:Protein of unknown function (DUF2849)
MTSPLDQKLKIAGPVVLTGNRVADGTVIYRDARGGWTTSLKAAAVITSAAHAQQMLAAAAADEIFAVGVYAAPVKLADGAPQPGNLREMIRAAGPTVEQRAAPGSESNHVRA